MLLIKDEDFKRAFEEALAEVNTKKIKEELEAESLRELREMEEEIQRLAKEKARKIRQKLIEEAKKRKGLS